MTFKAYRASASNYTQENLAFNELHDLLKRHWEERDDPLHLIGNVFVNGQEIDAIVLKQNALIVIDFKNYGGKLSFSENGNWKIAGRTVKGGSKANPYQQIRDNKFLLLNYLEEQKLKFKSQPNLGHISGLCLFHKNIEFKSQSIPEKIRSWFHVVDMDSALRTIEAIVSTQINMQDTDIDKIIGQLDVPRYFPDGKPIETEIDIPARPNRLEPIELNTEQMDAFVQIKDWLDDKNCRVFSLQGAYYTGKSKVIQKIAKELEHPIFLVPNMRCRNRYKTTFKNKENIHSIYGWLYGKVPNGISNGKQVYLVNRPKVDIVENVIVILDSHLLGDDHFEMETCVYGSGHILTDFLESFKLDKQKKDKKPVHSAPSLPKILLVGDPYQLKRASGYSDLMSCGVFEKRGIDYSFTELRSHDRDKNAPIERLDFQKNLIEQINEHRFLNLPKCSGGKIQAINKGEHTDAIAKKLLTLPKHTSYLCAKNDSAQSVNTAIRKKYLAASASELLVKGDIIEIYSGLIKTENGLQNEDQTRSGQFAQVVSINPEIENKSIKLKGRDKALIVRFAQARIKLQYGHICDIEYLPDFLSAVKPELSKDHSIALQIWAKKEADSSLQSEKAELDRLKNKIKKIRQNMKKNIEIIRKSTVN